jgi:hypothetical protein
VGILKTFSMLLWIVKFLGEGVIIDQEKREPMCIGLHVFEVW